MSTNHTVLTLSLHMTEVTFFLFFHMERVITDFKNPGLFSFPTENASYNVVLLHALLITIIIHAANFDNKIFNVQYVTTSNFNTVEVLDS